MHWALIGTSRIGTLKMTPSSRTAQLLFQSETSPISSIIRIILVYFASRGRRHFSHLIASKLR